MGVFDVSFLNPGNAKATSDYSSLVDGLSIKESQLSSDGKLSPGDYDLLIKQARDLYSHPGLTKSQRSGIEVKIANYQQAKSTNSISEGNDIGELNRNVQDDQSKINMRYSNDPSKYLQATAATLSAKIDQLSSSIDQMDQSGQDSSAHYNELSNTMKDYNDTLAAMKDVQTYDPKANGGAPNSDYAAYVTTNSRGEVVDMKIGRTGSQSGYLETNGVYGGLPLYGKLNHKEGGKNVFKLGNQQYSAPDLPAIGPNGMVQSSILISDDKLKSSSKGGYSIAERGYSPVDLTQVKPQSSVPPGGWIEGSKGFLYQSNGDGSYVKYVNGDKEKLGIQDGDIIKVPKSFEAGIINNVSKTVDPSLPEEAAPTSPVPLAGMAPNVGLGPNPTIQAATDLGRQQQQPPAPAPGPQASAAPQGTPRTPLPTQRAPQTAQGIAGKVGDAVKGFFGSVFG